MKAGQVTDLTSSAAPRSRHLPWLVGVLCAAVLTWWAAGRVFPYLPRPLDLQVVFPAGVAGVSEPLLATGRYERADFLNVNYLDAATAVIHYDAWGPGGPKSAPFELKPGTRRALRIETPGLDFGGRVARHERRPVRVWLDGVELLNAPVVFYSRRPEHAYFGCNPIGGNNEGVLFRGELSRPDGRIVSGGPEGYFTWFERFRLWFTTHPGEIALILLASVIAGALTPFTLRLARRAAARLREPLAFTGRPRAPHAAFAVTAFVSAALFTLVLTQGSGRLFEAEAFSDFYDHQAAAMLKGRLDVPREVLSGEAFMVGDKAYGYFGITPALMRLPFVATGVGFGKLARSFMLLEFLACLAAAYALLVHATRQLAGPGCWPSPWATTLLIGNVGLGSTLFFLSSRAYIYHEAILCGAAWALWAVFFTWRVLAAPEGRAWIGAWICGVAAVHARPPSGLFALAILGFAAGWLLLRSLARRQAATPASAPSWRKSVFVGLMAVIGVASFSGMSWLKFRVFDGMPLHLNVQYSPERRARFENRTLHLANLPHNLDAYWLAPDFHLEPRFPFFFFGAEKVRYYPESRIDLEEPTLAIPFASPGMFLLALAGAWAFCRARALRVAFAVTFLGVLPAGLALGAAIATSHRYSADFAPFIIGCAALGVAAIDTVIGAGRRAAFTALSTMTVVGILISLAITLRFQGEIIWGVTPQGKQNYEALRTRIDRWVDAPPRAK